jgi:hypothetical protein
MQAAGYADVNDQEFDYHFQQALLSSMSDADGTCDSASTFQTS